MYICIYIYIYIYIHCHPYMGALPTALVHGWTGYDISRGDGSFHFWLPDRNACQAVPDHSTRSMVIAAVMSVQSRRSAHVHWFS